MSRSIVAYETFHGSAKRAAEIIAAAVGTKIVNIDTPFEIEELREFDSIILCFNFRGPYTAQLTKLYLQRAAKQFKGKRVVLVGEGLFSEKEFPIVAEEIHGMIPDALSFDTFFIKGQLRLATLSPEEKALLGRFMELTGMKLTDMGEFDAAGAEAAAAKIAELVSLPMPEPEAEAEAPAARWICSVCGYIHTGDTPPERCPLCGMPAEKFNRLED